MPWLPSKDCPCCGHPIAAEKFSGIVPAATRFEKCLRRCVPCGIGFSNAADNPTRIYKDPLKNIPCESRAGASEALSHALNERSRVSKWRRFGFSTSEDAVTWVVFTYLLHSRQLEGALRRVGLISAKALTAAPTLLLWGAPIAIPPSCYRARGAEIRKQLSDLCTRLGENPISFSEPDVIIDLGEDGLIFIEAKYRSGNDLKPTNYIGWPLYLEESGLAWDIEKIRKSGCYELARNWRLLKGLADNEKRTVTLVNLGRADLFHGRGGERLTSFVEAISTDERSRFMKITWSKLLGDSLFGAPEWFAQFCRHRCLTA
jgi:hypothetical protein